MDNTNFYLYFDKIKSHIEQNLGNQLREFDTSMENFYREYKEYDTLFCMA